MVHLQEEMKQFEEDKLIAKYVIAEHEKKKKVTDSVWKELSIKLNKSPEEIYERYVQEIQYNKSLFKNTPFIEVVTPSPSPKKLNKKRKLDEIEDIGEFEDTPKKPKEKKVEKEIKTPEKIKEPKTPEKIKKSKTPSKEEKRQELEKRKSEEEKMIEKEKEKEELERKEKVKRFLDKLSIETGANKKEIIHALYFNSGDLLNTIKCLNTPSYDKNLLWTPEEDDLIKKKKPIKNRTKEQCDERRDFLSLF